LLDYAQFSREDGNGPVEYGENIFHLVWSLRDHANLPALGSFVKLSRNEAPLVEKRPRGEPKVSLHYQMKWNTLPTIHQFDDCVL